MSKLFGLVFLILLAAVAWMGYQEPEHYKSLLMSYFPTKEILTLEARYTPNRIMEERRSELLGDDTRSYQEPTLIYYPYYLLDVKFTHADKKPREAVALWSQVDGELVLNTDTWEKTHGFEDAMIARAGREDFKILNALAKTNGISTLEMVCKELHLDAEVVEPWVQSAVNKHLIIRKGNQLHLYFENPKILVYPQTKFNKSLVKKPYNQIGNIERKYSQSDIEKIAKASFGSEFTIRRVKEVFVPVYHIETLNADGSVHTSHWNAINGLRMDRDLISRR